jgi:ABC-type dipeptide/oligopeptide/nickel transport system permease component
MLQDAPATLSILAWCALTSVAVVLAAYGRAASRHERSPSASRQALRGMALLPALVLAPLAVALSFAALRLDLIYPVQMLASPRQLALAALAPALVLVLASGLAQTLIRSVEEGYARWHARPFAKVARAYGKEPRDALRRVVVLEALATAWSSSLPWLFSELIVVEAVFNAPGIGLAAWQAARERNAPALVEALVLLTATYAALALASALFNRRLGRRLESYA